tara:strand:- start:21 stop:221 length:201 start_codon:yes stop_codon:yes gene_type:complete
MLIIRAVVGIVKDNSIFFIKVISPKIKDVFRRLLLINSDLSPGLTDGAQTIFTFVSRINILVCSHL